MTPYITITDGREEGVVDEKYSPMFTRLGRTTFREVNETEDKKQEKEI